MTVDPIKVFEEFTPHFAAEITSRLQKALGGLVSDFRIHKSDIGTMTIYVEEEGFQLRLGGTILIEIVGSPWKEPFEPDPKPRFKGDNESKAGQYVLGGFQVKSTVNFPAINESGANALEGFQKAMEFARIILAAERFLQDIMYRSNTKMGVRYLYHMKHGTADE